MAEYQVKDYGAFSDAVNTTKTFGTNVSSVKDAVAKAKATLSDTSIFMGPIQENCMTVLAGIDTDFSTIETNYNALSNYLTNTNTSYQTADQKVSTTILNSTSSTIEEKKKAFLGNVDDPNNYDEVNPNYRSIRKEMTLFDNTTGEVMQDNATITMKPGETRVITVKLPTNTGMIQEIHRTSADGNDAYRTGTIVHAVSDVDPDPNNVDYVNYRDWANHIPSDTSMLHSNGYDWIITAYKDGTVGASQTCEYTTDVSKGENLKAMINLKVVVKSDDTTTTTA